MRVWLTNYNFIQSKKVRAYNFEKDYSFVLPLYSYTNGEHFVRYKKGVMYLCRIVYRMDDRVALPVGVKMPSGDYFHLYIRERLDYD